MDNETISIIFTLVFLLVVISYFFVMTREDIIREDINDELDFSNINYDNVQTNFDSGSWKDSNFWNDLSGGSSSSDGGSDSFADGGDGGGGGGD